MKVKKWPNKRCVRWPSVNARTGQVVMRGVAKCYAYLHVVHKSVKYTIMMHNEPRDNSNATFNAQEVLDSKLVSSLNKEYFIKGKR